jgi:asparagine synthase (glutamine-hydrolysing)
MRNTLLRDADVMSMASSLEVRVPLLDHVLVEHAFRVPGALKLRRGASKPLFTAAAPALPEAAVGRRKMGFTLPFRAWFTGSLRPWIEESLLGEPAASAGLFDRDAVGQLFRAFLADERRVSYARVFSLAALTRYCHAARLSL